MSKYRNATTVIDGEVFDSKKEAARWQELKLLERAHEISNLRRQVVYELLPNQYSADGKKLLERAVRYVADFVYEENGKTVVEDAKGVRTVAYILKRKLMLFIHGIRIKEV